MDDVLAGIDAQYAGIKEAADALCERIEREQDELAAEIRRRLDDEVNGAFLHIEEVVSGRDVSHCQLEEEAWGFTPSSPSPSVELSSDSDVPPLITGELPTPQEFTGSLEDFMSQQAEENAHLASLMSRCQSLLTKSVAEICDEQ